MVEYCHPLFLEINDLIWSCTVSKFYWKDRIMRNHLKTIFAVTITSLMLFGCKLDKIETSIGSEDLRKAIAGNTVSVEFKAEFSMMGDTDDEEAKSQIKSIKNIVEKYISVEEFDITKGDFGFRVKHSFGWKFDFRIN